MAAAMAALRRQMRRGIQCVTLAPSRLGDWGGSGAASHRYRACRSCPAAVCRPSQTTGQETLEGGGEGVEGRGLTGYGVSAVCHAKLPWYG